MRIGEMASGEEYRMGEELENLPIFGVKFLFSKLKKIPKTQNQRKNMSIDEIAIKAKYRKDDRFQNLTIF